MSLTPPAPSAVRWIAAAVRRHAARRSGRRLIGRLGTAEVHALSPTVSVVVPVHNEVALTKRCLESLAESMPAALSWELVIVDNASTDATVELLGALDDGVKVLTNPVDVGFGPACNQGAAVATGEILVFLHNDVEVAQGWWEPLVDALDGDADLAAVQPMVLYPDGRLNDAGGLLFADGASWTYGKHHPFPDSPLFACRRVPDHVSGPCLVVRRSAFEQVGGFDPAFAPAAFDAVDLSLALRHHGWRLLYVPASTVIHHEGGTTPRAPDEMAALQSAHQQRLVDKWSGAFAGRPALDRRRVDAWAHRPQAAAAPDRPLDADAGDGQRILVVDPWPMAPDRSAGHLRLFTLVDALRRRGHHVSYYTLSNRVGATEHARRWLHPIGVPAFGFDEFARPADPDTAVSWESCHRPDLAHLCRLLDIDTVVFETFSTAEAFAPVVRAAAPGVKVVLDTVDLHHVREERGRRLGVATRGLGDDTSEREVAACAAADVVITTTPADAETLQRLHPGGDIRVIPTFHPARPAGPGFEEREGLLFVGNFLHAPNRDGLRWWSEEVAPLLAELLPGVRLTVVGYDPGNRARHHRAPTIDVVGWVPDLVPWFHRHRLSVAPLRFGAGMKGKVGEALAAGTPVVATPVAVEGTTLTDGEHLLVAERARPFAEAVSRLYHDRELWDRLRRAGREEVDRTYGSAAVERAVADLLGSPRPAASAPRATLA